MFHSSISYIGEHFLNLNLMFYFFLIEINLNYRILLTCFRVFIVQNILNGMRFFMYFINTCIRIFEFRSIKVIFNFFLGTYVPALFSYPFLSYTRPCKTHDVFLTVSVFENHHHSSINGQSNSNLNLSFKFGSTAYKIWFFIIPNTNEIHIKLEHKSKEFVSFHIPCSRSNNAAGC